MAAPLPQGFQMQVMPQAPRMDPNVFAPDAQKTLQVAHSGMLLGQELANLQNKRAERELQAAKIAADSAMVKYQMRLLDDAELRLPDVHKAALAKLDQETMQARLQSAEAQALMSAQVPQTEAQRKASDATNALRTSQTAGNLGTPETAARAANAQAQGALEGANADLNTGFAGTNTPGRAQAVAAAQTLGSWGVSEGNLAEGEVPYQHRKTEIISDTDIPTGNTVQRAVTIDTRNGRVISKGDIINTTKLGVDEPSVKAAREAIAQVIQARDMTRALKESVAAFQKEHPTWAGQAAQGAFTVFANKSPQSILGMVQSLAGGKLQTSQATDLAARAAALQNFYTKMVAGSAVTVDEASRLQPLVANPGDMVDPKRMLEKLKGFEGLLDAKIEPFVISGAAAKSGMMPPRAAPGAPAAPAPAAAWKGFSPEVQQAVQRNQPVQYTIQEGGPTFGGRRPGEVVWVEPTTLPDGRPGIKLAKGK